MKDIINYKKVFQFSEHLNSNYLECFIVKQVDMYELKKHNSCMYQYSEWLK